MSEPTIDHLANLNAQEIADEDFSFGESFDPYADTRTSLDAEQAGVWVEVNPTTRAKVRLISSVNDNTYARAQEAAFRGVRGNADVKLQAEIHAKVFSQYGITDWQIKAKDKLDANGKPVPGKWVSKIFDYETRKPVAVTPAAIEKVLVSDEAIFMKLLNAANDRGRFLNAVVERDTGN